MTSNSSIPQLSYTVAQACKATGIGKTKLYCLIAEGRLEKIKVGCRTLIPARSLEALIR